MRRGLLQEELLKSPLHLLLEMDSNLSFTSSNLFDITVVPVDDKFCLMPIHGTQSHEDQISPLTKRRCPQRSISLVDPPSMLRWWTGNRSDSGDDTGGRRASAC